MLLRIALFILAPIGLSGILKYFAVIINLLLNWQNLSTVSFGTQFNRAEAVVSPFNFSIFGISFITVVILLVVDWKKKQNRLT